ncbi:MAG: head-tail connector protein [Janthinobacterium lividum]
MLTPPALAAPPLTLATVKAHLKLDPSATDEDVLLGGYLKAAVGMFRTESKRRWPAADEPVDVLVTTDNNTLPPTITTTVLGYTDPAVLNADEQGVAEAWLLLTLGHLYENRQSVAVGLNVTEVPLTCQALMKILREPTI